MSDIDIDKAWESARRHLEKMGVDPDEVIEKAARVIDHYEKNPYEVPDGPVFVPDDDLAPETES